MLSEFFVELARQNGWYDDPRALLGRALFWYEYFTHSAAFWFAFPLILGLTAGVWTDYFLREQEAALPQPTDETQNNAGRKKWGREPNYSAWDTMSQFTVDEAALLWNEIEPGSAPVTDSGSWRTMLIRGIESGEIKTPLTLNQKMKQQRGEFYVQGYFDVRRQALREYAEKNNFRPPFLFPEDRN